MVCTYCVFSFTLYYITVTRLLVCAPTNSAVDMLLVKLINTGLFEKTVLRRLVGYNHFISPSYNTDYDEFCSLPELEDSVHQFNDDGS